MKRLDYISTVLLLLGLLAVPIQAGPATLVVDLDTVEDATLGGPHQAIGTLGNAFYFWNTDPLTGSELWRTDGTRQGTVLVKDICPGRCDGRLPSAGALVGDRLLFQACDASRGCQLWKTDGTSQGTEIFATFENRDAVVGGFTSYTSWPGTSITDWSSIAATVRARAPRLSETSSQARKAHCSKASYPLRTSCF